MRLPNLVWAEVISLAFLNYEGTHSKGSRFHLRLSSAGEVAPNEPAFNFDQRTSMLGPIPLHSLASISGR